MSKREALSQYLTPTWAAEMIIRNYFPELTVTDTVLEPACGDGRFLMGIPEHVPSVGVEIDPVLAAQARLNTRSPIITGDFTTVDIPYRVTNVVGNPPFNYELIKLFMDRCYEMLDYGGKVGFILPVYLFQTARTGVEYGKRWSMDHDLIPRNLFPGMEKPLMFATFLKERQTRISGLFLYSEVEAMKSLCKEYRDMMVGNHSRAGVWRDVVLAALTASGGRAKLQDLYRLIENNVPTSTKFWREKVRQTLARHFTHVGPAEFSL